MCRDVKPSNILISSTGAVRLSDFAVRVIYMEALVVLMMVMVMMVVVMMVVVMMVMIASASGECQNGSHVRQD